MMVVMHIQELYLNQPWQLNAPIVNENIVYKRYPFPLATAQLFQVRPTCGPFFALFKGPMIG